MDENKYSYNKDADEWTCHHGNVTEKRKRYKTTMKGQPREGYKYYFNQDICQRCPMKSECICESRKKKILDIGLNTGEFYLISQKQNSPEFVKKFRARASIESKNAEQKRFHGLDRARGYGLKSVSRQAKLTAIAVNLKRISKIIVDKKTATVAMKLSFSLRNYLIELIYYSEFNKKVKQGIYCR